MNGKKATVMLVTLGFFAGILTAMAPAGAAGPRAPVYSVATPVYKQGGVAITEYNVNTGGNLTIELTVSNSGDNTTTATVILYFETDFMGGFFTELTNWTANCTINNDIPTVLAYEWYVGDYVPIFPMSNSKFWVNVSGDGATPFNKSFDIGSKFASASVGEVTVTSSNAINSSVLVLGVDTLTVKVNITAYAFGIAEMPAALLEFYLDDSFSDPLGEVSTTAMANGTSKEYTFDTNLVSAAPSFDNHIIVAQSKVGTISSENESAEFAVVEPKSDVIVTGFTASPATITLVKGATVPVNMTVTLKNNGTAEAATTAVYFFDGVVELNHTTVGPIAAGASQEVSYIWKVADTLALGDHTLAGAVDSQIAPDYKMEQVLTVKGKANVTVTNLTASATSVFEGENVTFTATLVNDGTMDAVNQSVSFAKIIIMGVGEQIGAVNVTVPKTGTPVTATFVYSWDAANISGNEETKQIRAGVGEFILTSFKTVNVTVKKKLPIIEFVSFSIPTGIRQYDDVLFNITVKNNGTVSAIGVTVKITKDGWTYCTTEPFNLNASQTRLVQALVGIMDPGDANQTFTATAAVGALSFAKNATVYVLHRIYAAIGVKAFTISPTKKENQPKDSTQSFTAKLTLKNIGEKSGSVQVLIIEGKKVLTNTTASVEGSASKDVSYTVKLSGAGKHKLTVVLSLPNPDPGNMTMNASCELQYQPGFEVVVVVAAVLGAVALFRRRKD